MKQEGKYAIFIYEKEDENLVNEISIYLDNKAEEIFAFFQVFNRDKVIVNIIPTKQQFDEQFILDHPWANKKKQVPKWVVGYYVNGSIKYLSLNDYKSTTHEFSGKNHNIALNYYKKTIVHEFVHYVNDLFKKKVGVSDTEKYLREGIAIYLSRQKENIDLYFDFTLEELLEKDMNKSCYNGWYIVTKYLVENYDKDFVLELFISNRKAREFLENELYNKVKEKYGGKDERRD